MNMLLENVFNVVVGSAMLLIFVRFMLEVSGIDRKDPFAKPIYGLTQVVDVFGRIFPTIGEKRINTAALVLMFLLRLIFMWGTATLLGKTVQPLHMFFGASISLILDFLMMCQIILSISVVASLVMMFTQSENPIWAFFMQLSETIVAPFRKYVPQMGMLDMGFMAAYAALYLAEIFVKVVANNLVSM